MKNLILSGCAPVPLAHYLKALGILRLVSEQKDSSAKGRWHRDQFVLESSLDHAELRGFFLEEYRPTPVMAPWNGGSGFFFREEKGKEKDPATGKRLKTGVRNQETNATKTLAQVLSSRTERFANIRAAILVAKRVLSEMELIEAPKETSKEAFVTRLRNDLPDEAVAWLDSTIFVGTNRIGYPPLLATGGTDGNLDFTNNFMQRITEVIDGETGMPQAFSAERLEVALFAAGRPVPLAKAPVGQFLPGMAGGANATSGFDAASLVNPWDFILMIEGALLFASASVKRLESSDTGALAYPFCVRQAGAGYASAASADESTSRAEMWMPIWTRNSATLPEVAAIFSEGRAQVGGRAAKNGVDFARAVVGLGVDRGLDEFQRYGFQVRNGLSYFATPLTRVVVQKNAGIDLLSDIDAWLDRLRRAATKDTAPASVRRVLGNLETRIFDLCLSDTPQRLMAVFLTLGQCEKTLAKSLKWARENFLLPLGKLRKAWLNRSWNHSTEFRLAAAVASIDGKLGKNWTPFRCHLEPVVSRFDKSHGALTYSWAEVATNNVQWSEAALPQVLNDIFARRLIFTDEAPENHFGQWASLSDICAFIEGDTDDALLSDLLWSMSLINWRENAEPFPLIEGRRPVPPALYATLKLCFPPSQKSLGEGVLPVPVVPAIHRRAAQGDGTHASELALRRLRASGYQPAIRQIPVQGDCAKRTAAALLFPIGRQTLLAILRQVSRPEKEPAASGAAAVDFHIKPTIP